MARTGRLKILTYTVECDGKYTLYLYGSRIATVDNYREAIEEDENILAI